jgi:hypothetical protein
MDASRSPGLSTIIPGHFDAIPRFRLAICLAGGVISLKLGSKKRFPAIATMSGVAKGREEDVTVLTSTHLKTVRNISVLLLIVALWLGLPFYAFAQSNNESTWYSRFIAAYGTHTKRYANGELEVNAPDNNGDLVSTIHDWLQDHFTKGSVENQTRELEPAIKSYIHNGAAGVLLEVRMYGASDFEYPFVFIYGAGQDFTDAFKNQLAGPSIGRDFPSGMTDPDNSYLTWAYERNGQLVFQDFPQGWNTTSTPAGREMVAANAAERNKYLFEQCEIAQGAIPLVSTTSRPPMNQNSSSAPSDSGGQTHALPHGGIDTEHNKGADTSPGTPRGDSNEGSRQTGDGSWANPWKMSPTTVEEDNLVQDATRPIADHTDRAQAQSQAPQNTGASAKPVVINGVVDDPDGNVVAGAVVRLWGPFDDPTVSISASQFRTSTTDGSGSFHFLDVQPGVWHLEADADGWAGYVSDYFKLSSPINLTIALKPVVENVNNMDWGIPGTRAWIDLDGQGVVDFCRVITPQLPIPSKKIMTCTYSSGPRLEQLYQGAPISIYIPAQDWSDDFAWVDVTGDHHLALCRALPNSPNSQEGRLSCLLSGSKFTTSVDTPINKVINLGIPSARAWVDVNGDGKTDFCTVILTPSGEHRLSCWLSEGDHFSDQPVMSENVEWQPDHRLRLWIDINSDKTTAFCTTAGDKNEFLDCTLWRGTKFGPTVRDLIRPPMTK